MKIGGWVGDVYAFHNITWYRVARSVKRRTRMMFDVLWRASLCWLDVPRVTWLTYRKSPNLLVHNAQLSKEGELRRSRGCFNISHCFCGVWSAVGVLTCSRGGSRGGRVPSRVSFGEKRLPGTACGLILIYLGVRISPLPSSDPIRQKKQWDLDWVCYCSSRLLLLLCQRHHKSLHHRFVQHPRHRCQSHSWKTVHQERPCLAKVTCARS